MIFSNLLLFSFFSCYYHHHHCKPEYINKFPAEKVAKKHRFDQVKKTYIQSLGYRVETIWECEWSAFLQANPHVRQQINEKQLLKYEGPAWEPAPLTVAQIKHLIQNDELYGFVCVDITVGEKGSPLYERCKEFSPFFKHASITRKDVGRHMEQFAKASGVLKTPQRALIGAMHAENFWVGTPLLKWYLDLGCTVSKIHEIVQYEGVSVFKDFVDSIVKARIEADAAPQKEIHGTQAKLIGKYYFL